VTAPLKSMVARVGALEEQGRQQRDMLVRAVARLTLLEQDNAAMRAALSMPELPSPDPGCKAAARLEAIRRGEILLPGDENCSAPASRFLTVVPDSLADDAEPPDECDGADRDGQLAARYWPDETCYLDVGPEAGGR